MMIQKIKVHSILDCRGLYCPVPIANTREEINKLESGQILQVITDDPASFEDIPRWAKRTGHTLIDMWKDGDNFYFIIRKEKTEDETSQYSEWKPKNLMLKQARIPKIKNMPFSNNIVKNYGGFKKWHPKK